MPITLPLTAVRKSILNEMAILPGATAVVAPGGKVEITGDRTGQQ